MGRPKRLATSGRNVEGATYLVVDHGGERMVRCKLCGKTVVVARWWFHGTAEDPHEAPPAGM